MELMLIFSSKRSISYEKNVFLYVVIAVLAVALVGLGALNVRSLNKLESLQSKVSDLQKNVQEVSDSAAELSSKADQLDALYADDPTVESAAAAASRILRIPALRSRILILPQILPQARKAQQLHRKRALCLLPVEAALLPIIPTPAWTTY